MEMRSLGPRSFTEHELVHWGEKLGAAVEPPLWVSLDGPLGAGKSVLVRSICRGAGVSGLITSPSFTLVQPYTSPRGFGIHHVDLFRLRPGEPMEPLGWEELIGAPGLVLIEWADRASSQQPKDRWEITLEYGECVDDRVVEVRSLGDAPGLIGW